MLPEYSLIGVGSPHGDDQAGWWVMDAIARRLKATSLVAGSRPDTFFTSNQSPRIHRATNPLQILDYLDGARWLGICDACHSGGVPGTWQSWQWPNPNIMASRFSGTHDLGLVATLELGQRLGRLPDTIWIWGIELQATVRNAAPSPAIIAAIPEVAENIMRTMSGL